MFPTKNSILGIENLCIGPLLKRISFFEKFFDHDLKFWIQHFMLFLVTVWVSKCTGFLNIDLYTWERWEVDLMLGIGQYDPKWYPKALLLISHTYFRTYSLHFLLLNIFAYGGDFFGSVVGGMKKLENNLKTWKTKIKVWN